MRILFSHLLLMMKYLFPWKCSFSYFLIQNMMKMWITWRPTVIQIHRQCDWHSHHFLKAKWWENYTIVGNYNSIYILTIFWSNSEKKNWILINLALSYHFCPFSYQHLPKEHLPKPKTFTLTFTRVAVTLKYRLMFFFFFFFSWSWHKPIMSSVPECLFDEYCFLFLTFIFHTVIKKRACS